MLMQHAHAGGELGWDHRVHLGGTFMPFYVPRPFMPQIDEADMPALLEFLREQHVSIKHCEMAPTEIRPHQLVDKLKVARLDDEALRKPCLISLERFILDGHHRWAGHVYRHTLVPVHHLCLPFEQAMAMLFRFPKTYSYGDGAFHPIRN